jgi:hypothetical protein
MLSGNVAGVKASLYRILVRRHQNEVLRFNVKLDRKHIQVEW